MNEYIEVIGGNPLQGEVVVEGAKNAVLPIMAAALLSEEGVVTLKNVPKIEDVTIMADILRKLNAKVEIDWDKHQVMIDASQQLNSQAPYELVEKMRASIVIMGPLLARNLHAEVSMPGGDEIGSRPIDLHLKGFEKLGATTSQQYGEVIATAESLSAGHIYLDFPSVGATQNIMMAATCAKGVTILENAATEPEIVDLANILNKMGANIHGAGTDEMRITGVEKLHGTTYSIVQDRIVAGTFMICAALTKGNILVKDAMHEHNRPLISKLKEMGAIISETDEGIRVKGPEKLRASNIKTLPHPGYPTDLQAQFTILQTQAVGTSITKETIFENRFQHLLEMKKMHLDCEIQGDTAIIHGENELIGASVYGTDIRAAASLVLAGLVARGATKVYNLEHIDRGYYNFHEKLKQLGANIRRVKE